MRPCRGPDRPQDRRQRGRREAAADARIFFEYTGLRPSMPRDVIGTLMSAPHLVPVASQPTATNRPETVAPTVPTRDATPPNRDVPVAAGGEFRPLRLGHLRVWPPVVLAPMAGVTNYPFRTLCREFGAGLYVSEMITARGFLEGNGMTRLLASGRPGERPRSVQLYGSNPSDLEETARIMVRDGGGASRPHLR